ncbi:uncharacterized protein XB13580952.L [Xenopus laevis]|uniref:SAM domain-containing protein n=2 Tax=Xenopus laevis TaxID=8355 RepID=A0A974HTD9_XENLA|nr:uncharacterized protein XB13580952.L [Xenopus laevis]OCT89373.1 hypothetical protein XELAEV_18017994mg [Xenopus laevis]
MDPTGVRWTENEYTLNGYLSKYISSFPSIIKITEGFLGKQEIDSISSSMVIRVHSLYSQRRVIAESRLGKLFSLPIKLKTLKFITTGGSSPINGPNLQCPMTLQEIVTNYHLPVGIHSSKALSFKEKGDEESQEQILPELLLKDTYEENFLLGHPIDKGKIFTKEPIMVPMYMKELRLVVALGFTNDDTNNWNKTFEWLTKQVDNEGDMSEVTFEEIYLLDKKNLSSNEPRYSTIEPIYIDISELGMEQQRNKTLIGTSTHNERHISRVLNQTAKYSLEGVSQVVSNVTTPITNINDIPKDLRGLTVNQVCKCLNLLNMNQYEDAFKGAQVDGQFLYELNCEMMKSCLGMNGLHAVKLMKFRDGWRPNMQDQ